MIFNNSSGLTLHVVREKLQTIFKNAVFYNSEAIQMVCISRHVDGLVKAIWQETLALPYDNRNNANLNSEILSSRLNRLRLCFDEKLTVMEAKELYNAFVKMSSFVSSGVNSFFQQESLFYTIFETTIDVIRNALQSPCPSSYIISLSLKDILMPLIVQINIMLLQTSMLASFKQGIVQACLLHSESISIRMSMTPLISFHINKLQKRLFRCHYSWDTSYRVSMRPGAPSGW
jgi:hypothetical protein